VEDLSFSGKDLAELISGFFNDSQNCSMKISCNGSSMTPFIKNGSTLILAPVNTTSLKVGSVMVAIVQGTGCLLVHRVIAISQHGYQLKGDNNCMPDGWFQKKDFLAQVIVVEDTKGCSRSTTGWRDQLIALASRTKVLQRVFLPGLRFYKRLFRVFGNSLPLSLGSKSGT
jgi:signal peptidase I